LWTFGLALDGVTLAKVFGPYFSPVFFAVLVIGLVLESGTIARRDTKFALIVRDLMDAATGTKGTSFDVFSEFAIVLMHKAQFNGAITYVDGILSGITDRRLSQFQRLDIFGDVRIEMPTIASSEGDLGETFKRALESGIPMRAESGTCEFVLVPIGQNALICLFQSTGLAAVKVSNLEQIVSLSTSAFRAVDDKLLDATMALNSSLARVKKELSNGSYPLTSGAIFFDVVDYSKHCENFGLPYAEYISAKFFPALMKYMDGYATPESIRGDEIYFVVCTEVTKSKRDVLSQTAEAVVRLNGFLIEEGKTLSSEHGFPKPDFRIGVSIGEGNLVVDDVIVRTSGEHINRAKRLQDSANRNEILVDSVIADCGTPIVSIGKKIVVVKKNEIEATKIGIKRRAA